MAKYVKTEQGYQEIETTVAPVVNQEIETTVAPMVGEKMDKNNPVGTGSFSMGRKTGSSVGLYSHAEGHNTTASSTYSHAEGGNTTASGSGSHAEGYATTASGIDSHAEGISTTASGDYSHAEGNRTTASGYYSHAEGENTVAFGENSHAEGLLTSANSSCQHVQGKFNIRDEHETYAHIVGNGTNDQFRSNAHTLDWNGNAWYAGDVYVGSTSGVNKDEGSKKLATEEYVDSKQDTLIQSGASVGQIAKITAVDSSGKPTAWQAVDMPSGGGTMRWQKIKEITLTEQTNDIVIGEDDNGVSVVDYNPIAMKVEFHVPADSTQTNANGAPWIYPSATYADNNIRAIGSIAAWKTVTRRQVEFFIGDINGIFAGGNVNSQLVPDPSNKPNITVMDGVTLRINSTEDHWPVGTIVSLEVLSGRA